MLATGFAHSQALATLAGLGVADSLAGGALPVGELARRGGVDAGGLGRLLHAASSNGIFK